MSMALGKMQMSPNDFWNMSMQEFILATEGFVEFNSDGKPPPMTRNELDSLMERYPD